MRKEKEVGLVQADAGVAGEEGVGRGRGKPGPTGQIVLTARTEAATATGDKTSPATGDTANEGKSTPDLSVQSDAPDEQNAHHAAAPVDTDNTEPTLAETVASQPAPVSSPDALSTDIPEPPKPQQAVEAASAPTTQCTIHWGLTLIEA